MGKINNKKMPKKKRKNQKKIKPNKKLKKRLKEKNKRVRLKNNTKLEGPKELIYKVKGDWIKKASLISQNTKKNINSH